ncbi:hypothetical protein E2C01_059111 [Portunus trituberculatus]|uniref:Uncharacterized protein n=1 Tax=Portunus trituberculatus TaxID=210409 RepID=A0A5B7H576_PORTR|nr:hypothetical protein [Portunus trituberculatus]
MCVMFRSQKTRDANKGLKRRCIPEPASSSHPLPSLPLVAAFLINLAPSPRPGLTNASFASPLWRLEPLDLVTAPGGHGIIQRGGVSELQRPAAPRRRSQSAASCLTAFGTPSGSSRHVPLAPRPCRDCPPGSAAHTLRDKFMARH